MWSRQVAILILVLGIGLLGYTAFPALGPQYTHYEQTAMIIDDPDQKVTAVLVAGAELKLTRRDAEVLADLPKTLKPSATFYPVEIRRADQPAPILDELQVLPRYLGYLAAVAALLVVLALPEVLLRSTGVVTTSGRPVTGWTFLLVEQGGLSLARVQLIMFFVPTAVVYMTLAIPLHEFPTMPASIWQLLGAGGATAAISTIITPRGSTLTSSLPMPPVTLPSPAPAPDGTAPAAAQIAAAAQAPAPAAPAAPPAAIKDPAFSDLFVDDNGYGDISHYQSFIICASTAWVFLFSFFDKWEVPDIPDQVLQLLGASLAIYLGVKGIKVVQKGNADKSKPAA